MKLRLSCMECVTSRIKQPDNTDMGETLLSAEFNDDGSFEVECEKGHHSIVILQQQKFEVLFEIGAFAIKDGYYREAVSSFTSSLERFYEFYIKVISISKGISWDNINSAWKNVSNQSERQLGAFIFLYLQENGEVPSLLTTPQTTFRNAIIHKGKIPTREEAVKYGQSVMDLIRPIISKLKLDYKVALDQATLHHLSETRTQSKVGVPITTASIATIINYAFENPERDKRNLDEVLSRMHSWGS